MENDAPARALTVPLPTPELLQTGAPWEWPVAYLDRPADRSGMAAYGVLRQLKATRTGEVFGHLERVLGEAGRYEPLDELSAGAPGPWFGGMTFDPTAPLDSRWSELGMARFTLPRWIAWRSGDQYQLTRLLAPGEDPTRARAEAQALAAQARPGAPLSNRPGRGRLTQTNEARYRGAVAQALTAIQEKSLLKVMVARALDAQLEAPVDPLALLTRLRGSFPTCTTFLFRGDGQASFVGATPEHLCVVHGTALSTEALAGTARHEDAEELLRSKKDLHEHRTVVEGIRAALVPYAEQLEIPDTPRLKPLPNVVHLHTPIRAQLKGGAPLSAVLAALHPTPSVGGEPRPRALAFLRDHEQLSRGWYAGPIGSFGAGRMDVYVALRCALLEGHHARLFVGAGIVAGSQPESELKETALKAQVLLGALGLGTGSPAGPAP